MSDEIERGKLAPIADSLIGASLAALAATGASLIAAGHRWEVSMPLAFVAILLLISVVFGTRAGILGTLLAALIFAVFLLRPPGRLHVSGDVARANLAWMLLLGLSFSLLFAPEHSGFHRR